MKLQRGEETALTKPQLWRIPMADEADVEWGETQVPMLQRAVVGRVTGPGSGSDAEGTGESERDLSRDVKLDLRLQCGAQRVVGRQVQLGTNAAFDIGLDQAPIPFDVQVNQRERRRSSELVVRVRRHLQADIRLVEQVDFGIVRAELELVQVSIDERDGVGGRICPPGSVGGDTGCDVGGKVSGVVVTFSLGIAAAGAPA